MSRVISATCHSTSWFHGRSLGSGLGAAAARVAAKAATARAWTGMGGYGIAFAGVRRMRYRTAGGSAGAESFGPELAFSNSKIRSCGMGKALRGCGDRPPACGEDDTDLY